jgi:hypothetical protein
MEINLYSSIRLQGVDREDFFILSICEAQIWRHLLALLDTLK